MRCGSGSPWEWGGSLRAARRDQRELRVSFTGDGAGTSDFTAEAEGSEPSPSPPSLVWMVQCPADGALKRAFLGVVVFLGSCSWYLVVLGYWSCKGLCKGL